MKQILAALLIIGSLQSSAQQIMLKSGAFTPEKNVTQLHSLQGWSDVTYNQHVYALIQFSKSTSIEERQQITESTGILFFDYIPKFAFIAAIPTTVNVADLSMYNVQSVVPFQANYKMDPVLNNRPFPTWMVKGNQQIEVRIEIQNNISSANAQSLLADHQIQVLAWKSQSKAIVLINENDLTTLAQLPIIKHIEPTSAPAVLENLTERSNHRVNTIDAAYTTGLHYDGTGVGVAIGDDGLVGPHIDFQGRLTLHPASINNGGTHADHVVGIVGGGGNYDPVTSGNGRGSSLHVYEYYNNLTSAPADYVTDTIRVTSNSLGQGCNVGYDSDAQDQDDLIRSHFGLLSVHSSGNSGGTTCGGVGQGFFTITGGYKAGKNAIATGNVENDDQLAGSSSKGPSADGRIKPDIVATGTDVYSTQPNNTYDTFTGTSMACPGVSGTLASLIQAYRATHTGIDPYSGLMKGLLLGTADDLGNKGPDFSYGFGRINARRAFNAMNNTQYFIDSVNTGDVKFFNVNAPANTRQVKVTLYWNDPQGSTASAVALVNNLDLYIEDVDGTPFYPLVLDNTPNVASLTAPAVPGVDNLNNVEQVVLDSMQSGPYTFYVSGTDVPQGIQKFVVVYEFIGDEITLTYPQGGESFVDGVTERVRWDAYSNDGGDFTLEYSSNAGASWNVISSTIAPDQRYYDWTPPASLQTGQMKMRISRGAVSDESDTLFTIFKVPTDLSVDTACGNIFHLIWSPVAGATGYRVFMLGAKYMEVIGTSTTPDFYVTTGVNTSGTYYFAVAADESVSGAKGQRTLAYVKMPGEINCSDLMDAQTILPFESAYDCTVVNLQPIKAQYVNVGPKDVTGIPVGYRINALAPVTEFYPGTLLIGDTLNYTFTTLADFSVAGNYTVKTWCGLNSDNNRGNDTSMNSLQVIPPVVLTAPTVQDFEGALFPPNGWRVFDADTSVKWQKTLCMQGAYGGNTHAAYMDFFNYTAQNAIDDLETPQLDLTGVSSDSVLLTFDVAHATGGAGEADTLSVLASNDCTLSFVPTSYKKWGINLATVGMMNTIFSPIAVTQWRNESVDLSMYKGQKIFIRFRGTNRGGNNVYIDNVNLMLKNVTPLTLGNGLDDQSLSVYPNPSEGNYVLDFNVSEQKTIHYAIYNMAGQKLRQYQIRLTAGHTKSSLDITDLPSGIYMLEMSDKGQTKKVKLTKY